MGESSKTEHQENVGPTWRFTDHNHTVAHNETTSAVEQNVSSQTLYIDLSQSKVCVKQLSQFGH